MRLLHATLVVLLWVVAVSSSPSTTQRSGVIVLAGARVYPAPDGVPIDDALVVLDGSRIAAVGPRKEAAAPQGATVLDCSGLVIVAGFYNAHVHFTDMSRWEAAATQPAASLTAQLSEMVTKYGYTTVVDTASDLANTGALRRRILAGDVAGPRILTAGFALYPPDGVPYYVRDSEPADVVSRLPRPATAAAVARSSRRRSSAAPTS
jgi:imidazolonepropionase-like amidohydrolase